MTKDRKRILLGGWTGAIFIALGYAMISSNYSFLKFVGGLLIIFTYLVWQFAIGYPLINKKDITADGKAVMTVLNASGEDVSKRLPGGMLLHLPCLVIICGFLIHYTHGFMIDLKKLTTEYKDVIIAMDDILAIYMPYLVIHSYFFIKDLPVSTITRYYQAGDGSAYNSSGSIVYPNSNWDYYYSPSSSSYGSNIYHSSRRDN